MATLDQAVATLAPAVGTVAGLPGGRPAPLELVSPPPAVATTAAPAAAGAASPQPRALSAVERQQVLEVLHDPERFWDAAPASVYATLLDEGSYLCSISTMYRLLREHGETGDRRRHATHPAEGEARAAGNRAQPGAGRGTSPSWPARPSGPGSTCT